jgi:peptide/nickel transport system permease protein
MLIFLLKRLLLLLPALWLISSVVFIFSKLIPGDALSDRLFSSEQMAAGTASTAARQAVYAQYRQKTGLDLPLFYAGIRTAAEPDTLHRVWPAPEREFLQRLVFQYGNWPEISRYYHSLIHLRQTVQEAPLESASKQALNTHLLHLFTAPGTDKTQQIFSGMLPVPADSSLLRAIHHSREAFRKILAHATPHRNYLPVVQWNGLNNQYHRWLREASTGNLGISYRDARPVRSAIAEAIGNTFLLALSSICVTFLLAVLLNVFVLHRYAGRWRQLILSALYLLDSVPVFLLALLLLTGLAGGNFLHIFPVYGLGDLSGYGWLESIPVRLYYLTLPLICLSFASLPYVTVQLYQAMREVELQDFITTARAKGLSERRITGKHMLRNALLPLITLFSDFLPGLVGGALIIEVLFAIPGTGSLLVSSVLSRDYPVILGIVLIIAFVKIASHMLADVMYHLADPRVKL